MNSLSDQVSHHKVRLAIIVILAIGLYGFLPQLMHFKGSWSALSKASWSQLWPAIVATGVTYVAAALLYVTLAFRKLAFWRTLVVQFAAMFVNRLLPAGTGAMGMNGAYLRRQKHSLAQAGTVVGVNNLIGFFGNMLLLAGLLLFGNDININFQHGQGVIYLYIGLAVLLAGLVYVLFRFMPSGRHLLRDILRQVVAYRKRKAALSRALLLSMVLTLGNACCLYFCARSVGAHITLTSALVALTAGIGAATVVPTPGGLGAIEAGLYAGLVAGHANGPSALSAVLLFRLINFWLPLLPGSLALVYVQRRIILHK